jgi:hypothetical protein
VVTLDTPCSEDERKAEPICCQITCVFSSQFGQQRLEDIAEQIIHARISRHYCQFTWNTFWVQIFLNIPENGFEKCLLGAPFKSKIMVFIRMIFIKELILYLLFSAPSCNNRLTLF